MLHFMIFVNILSPIRKVERYASIQILIVYTSFAIQQLIIILFQRGIIVILRVTLSVIGKRDRPRTQFNDAHHRDVHGPKY